MLIRLRDEIARRRSTLCRQYEGLTVESVLDIDGNLEYISESRKELLGYEPEEFLHRCVLNVCHPEDVENVRIALTRMVETQNKQYYNFRLQHKNGHWIPVHGHGAPLMEDGKVCGFIVVFHERIDRDVLVQKEDLEGKILSLLHKQKRTG